MFGTNTTNTGGFSLGGSTLGSTGFNLGSSSSFGSGLSTTQPSLATTTTTAPTTTTSTTTPLLGSLSTTAATPALGTSSTLPTLGTLGGLGSSTLGATTNPTVPTTTTSTATTIGTTAPTAAQTTGQSAQTTTTPATTITFKILEDYINKWMGELDGQEKDFLNQATQLNALDKLMIENGDKIVDVSNEVDCLSNEQDQLEQELNFLYSQQNDLEESIKKLESGIDQMPTIPQTHMDSNRNDMYKSLIEVDNQLKTMSGDLREIIKRLNDTNVNMNDPIVQISKILNAHMDSLSWIEENTNLIQMQTDKLTKVLNERQRETDNPTKFSFLS